MSRWVDLDNGMHHLIGEYIDHEMWSIDPDAIIGSREEEEQDTAAAYFSGYIKGHADGYTKGKASEQASCPYCREDADGHVKPLEKNCHATIYFSAIDDWHISIKANGWRGIAKINYCPMCGRRLGNG